MESLRKPFDVDSDQQAIAPITGKSAADIFCRAVLEIGARLSLHADIRHLDKIEINSNVT
jgi:hypothetical protein